MIETTEQQKEILDYIKKYMFEHNYPPAILTISKDLHYGRTSIEYHLEKLKKEGIIKIGDYGRIAVNGMRYIWDNDEEGEI